jgi:ribosomal protein S4
VVAPFGLVRVNGTTIRSAGHLLAAGDQLQVD